MLFSVIGAAIVGLVLAGSATAKPAMVDAVVEKELLPRWDTPVTVTVTQTLITTPSWCTTGTPAIPPPTHPSSPTTTPYAPGSPPASSTPASPVTPHVPTTPYVPVSTIGSLISSMNSEVSSYNSKLSSILSTPAQSTTSAKGSSSPSATYLKSSSSGNSSSTPASATATSSPSAEVPPTPNVAGQFHALYPLAIIGAALPIMLAL